MEMLKENFLRIFANLPLSMRDDIILVYKDRPITWNVAWLEIRNDTENAPEILKELRELELI